MDEPETTIESEEEASSPQAAEAAEQETTTESPPWGDDFDPARAWDTIQTQRQSEEELKQEVQRHKEVLDALRDPQRQAEALRAFGIELADEDTEPEDEDDGDPYLTREEWEQYNQQRQQQESVEAFNADLDEAAKGAKVKLSDWDRVRLYEDTMRRGGNADALEKALGALVEERETFKKEVIAGYRESKQGPRPLPGGREANDDSNRLDIEDDAERHRRQAERLRMNQ